MKRVVCLLVLFVSYSELSPMMSRVVRFVRPFVDLSVRCSTESSQKARVVTFKTAPSKSLARATGFNQLIKIIKAHQKQHNIHGVKGHKYELAVALLLQDQGIVVSAINHVPEGMPSCEFDLVTEDSCIECKNIIMNDRHLEELWVQFTLQKHVAERLGKTFIVYFKNDITKKMRKWLNENDIQYIIT